MLRGKSIFFYSRRIGKAPQGYFPDERYTDFPAQTTILAAAKIKGMISGGWDIGIISALTSQKHAEVEANGETLYKENKPPPKYSTVTPLFKYKPGSVFSFVWIQNHSLVPYLDYLNEPWGVSIVPQGDILLAKFSYRFKM